MKKAFIVRLDVYKIEILVCVGPMTKDEIISNMKRLRCHDNFVEEYSKVSDDDIYTVGWFWQCPKTHGSMISIQYKKIGWEFWETLIHETHHAIHFLLTKGRNIKSHEALAYAQECLFHKIRTKLGY